MTLQQNGGGSTGQVVFHADAYHYRVRMLSRNWRRYSLELCDDGLLYWYRAKTSGDNADEARGDAVRRPPVWKFWKRRPVSGEPTGDGYFKLSGKVDLHLAGSQGLFLGTELLQADAPRLPFLAEATLGKRSLDLRRCLLVAIEPDDGATSRQLLLFGFTTHAHFSAAVRALKRVGVVSGRIGHLVLDPTADDVERAGTFRQRRRGTSQRRSLWSSVRRAGRGLSRSASLRS